MRLIWIAFLAAGCTVEKGTDADGDGYESGQDCNDDDPKIRPNTAELCDGKDNNCDGNVDEDGGFGEPFWYPDSDADDFGDANQPLQSCAQPAGYVEAAGDCDDTNKAINPSAREVCDEADNDCDGRVDIEAERADTWYEDADGDGFGNPDVSVAACTAPKNYVDNDEDCDDSDETLAALQDYYPDEDGDGYGDIDGKASALCSSTTKVLDHSDCDDADAASHPDASESCDGVDNNCDGAVDEGLSGLSYMDMDGDGYGDPTLVLEVCNPPAGYVSNMDDCNDADISINPMATEVCDTQDNNCDGSIDEGVVPTWYLDVDGDGYGDINNPLDICVPPFNYVANADDCLDVASGVYPGAPEVCDTYDNDCNGQVDEGVLLTFYADADADNFGDPNSTTEDCNAPTGYLSDNTDCDDTSADTNPDALENCSDGTDNNCDGQTDEAVYAAGTSYTLTGTKAATDAAAICASGNAISKNLTIDAATLTDLSDIACICTIDGNLNIQNNTGLTSLTGLSLVTVGGSVTLDSNDVLADVSGFSSLSSIGNDLTINNNAVLTNTTGLEGITALNGSLTITDNVLLTDLNGLTSITDIGGDLTITGNTSLKKTDAFAYAAIPNVVGTLTIKNNAP